MTYQKQKYSQRDWRWRWKRIGNTNLGRDGCLITDLAMLVGIRPDKVADILIKAKLVQSDGEIVLKAACEALHLRYGGLLTSPPATPAICEVKWLKSRHFVLWVADKIIIDPWDAKMKDLPANYIPLDWRLVYA